MPVSTPGRLNEKCASGMSPWRKWTAQAACAIFDCMGTVSDGKATMRSKIDRRGFLLASGAATGALGWNGFHLPHLCAQEAAADASKLVAGKDGRLIVHNAKTLELETPLELLREQPITAKDRL